MTYKLVSENLTNLGGPMGTEYTYNNWEKYFSTEQQAKKVAEEDFGEPIKWVKEGDGLRSPDLRWVMYHIEKVKVEE